MTNEIKIENIKTQEDLDKAIAEAKKIGSEGTLARIAKKEGVVDKKTYDELSKSFDKANKELLELKVMPKVKEAFTKAGGVEGAFNDFYNSYNANLNTLEGESLTKFIADKKAEKAYMFKEAESVDTSGNLEAAKDQVEDKGEGKEIAGYDPKQGKLSF